MFCWNRSDHHLHAIRNEQMQCHGERLDYLDKFSVTALDDIMPAITGGVIAAVAIVAAAAILVVYRRRRQSSPALDDEMTKANPNYERSEEKIVIERLKKQVTVMEKAFTKMVGVR